MSDNNIAIMIVYLLLLLTYTAHSLLYMYVTVMPYIYV